MKEQTQQQINMEILPKSAYLPINHCNLPAVILGSLTYQQHPVPLSIDSMSSLYKELFHNLNNIDNAAERCNKFKDYMAVYFQITELEASRKFHSYKRIKANYLYILRGWLFDSDNREGAILKGWVESRFGLLPKWHKEKINTVDDLQYLVYMHERTSGIYNTNALESQLDLLYSYCQFEIDKKYKNNKHITLYRGINGETEKEIRKNNNILLMNNINSFSSTKERADEFGDSTIEVKVPVAKVFFYSGLLPGLLQGEDENIIIGGLYKVKICPAISL